MKKQFDRIDAGSTTQIISYTFPHFIIGIGKMKFEQDFYFQFGILALMLFKIS